MARRERSFNFNGLYRSVLDQPLSPTPREDPFEIHTTRYLKSQPNADEESLRIFYIGTIYLELNGASSGVHQVRPWHQTSLYSVTLDWHYAYASFSVQSGKQGKR